MTYTQSIEHIYKKIDNIAKQGKDGIFTYYRYLTELLDADKYTLLEDTMYKKYDLIIDTFRSFDEFKIKSFDVICEQTLSSAQKNIKKIFDKNEVYAIGFHFYDANTNLYLGDIKEINTPATDSNYYDGLDMHKKEIYNSDSLEVIIGLSSSIYDAVPTFNIDTNVTINYPLNTQVIYNTQLYICINSYTHSNTNNISPTNSTYWTPTKLPTYSYTLIKNNLELHNKYKIAINILKSNQ